MSTRETRHLANWVVAMGVVICTPWALLAQTPPVEPPAQEADADTRPAPPPAETPTQAATQAATQADAAAPEEAQAATETDAAAPAPTQPAATVPAEPLAAPSAAGPAMAAPTPVDPLEQPLAAPPVPGAAPPVDAPPVEAPPVGAPPVGVPPVGAPPVAPPASDVPPAGDAPAETTEAPQEAEPSAETSASENDAFDQAEESEPNNVFIPVPMDGSEPMFEELKDLENFFVGDHSAGGLFSLLFGILAALGVSVGLRRLRGTLSPTGLLPALLAFAHIAARLFVVAFAIAFIARFLPPRATLILLLAFVGFAVALGWSSRDVLPDMIAGLVLAFERRIRPGMWIASGDVSGMVESVGIRATIMSDAQGRTVSVPNRHLLRSPVTSDGSHELEQEVLLRLETDAPADQIRGAIRDAILSSPFVLPGSEPLVLRDPDDAWIWQVRVRLLAMRYAVTFEGELLERSEEMLAATRSRVERDADEGGRATPPAKTTMEPNV